MLYKNAYIFLEGQFHYGSFRVEDGRFAAISDIVPAEPGVDLDGAYVIPGLVDMHCHGSAGADFSDGDYEGLVAMARYLAENGITSFAPTSVTLPYGSLEKAFRTGKCLYEEKPAGCARLMGIHMEGPFLSAQKKGAQKEAYLQAPDFAAFQMLQDSCNGLVKLVDVAPELPGAAEFIRKASDFCTVSVAHTAASYEEARAAFAVGAGHVTHLFNGMSPVHHRAPGVVGAAFEKDTVTAEMICDGVHVHPAMVKMAFRLFSGRIVLVSDSLRCCGMPDGEYCLGGQRVFLRNGTATLADGTVAGGAMNLYACMKHAIKFGIPKEEAILSATLHPAKVLGCDKEVGSLAPGKRADFVVCDKDLNRKQVYLAGIKAGN